MKQSTFVTAVQGARIVLGLGAYALTVWGSGRIWPGSEALAAGLLIFYMLRSEL